MGSMTKAIKSINKSYDRRYNARRKAKRTDPLLLSIYINIYRAEMYI